MSLNSRLSVMARKVENAAVKCRFSYTELSAAVAQGRVEQARELVAYAIEEAKSRDKFAFTTARGDNSRRILISRVKRAISDAESAIEAIRGSNVRR